MGGYPPSIFWGPGRPSESHKTQSPLGSIVILRLTVVMEVEGRFMVVTPPDQDDDEEREPRYYLGDMKSRINRWGHADALHMLTPNRTEIERSRIEDDADLFYRDPRARRLLNFESFVRPIMNKPTAEGLIEHYLSMDSFKENSFRTKEKEVGIMWKMIEEEIVPFILKNKVWCLDETYHPVNRNVFRKLKHLLEVHDRSILHSNRWKQVLRYYKQLDEIEAYCETGDLSELSE